MSYATILAQLKILLDAVTGIGTTFDYFRLSHDEQTLKATFVSSGKLHAWIITRAQAPGENQTTRHTLRNHAFDIYGYYAIDDTNASEKTFQQLCDVVMNKLDEDDNIALVTNVYVIAPSQLISFEPVMFCDVLCHRAIIRITAEEELVRG